MIKSLAEKYECTRNTIMKVIEQSKTIDINFRENYKLERNKAIIQDYKNDLSMDQICEKYDIRPVNLYKIIKKSVPNDETRAEIKRKDMEIRNNKIIRDYFEYNISQKDIAQKYNLNKDTIKHIIAKVNPNKKTRKENPELVARNNNIYHDHVIMKISKTDIMKKYSLSDTSVNIILKSLGYKTPAKTKDTKLEERNKNIYHNHTVMKISKEDLAKKYNLSKSMISKIIKNISTI